MAAVERLKYEWPSAGTGKKVAFAERRFDCKIYGRSFLSFTRFPKHLNLCVFTKFHMRSYKTCVFFFFFSAEA